jgi:hypothetical protein
MNVCIQSVVVGFRHYGAEILIKMSGHIHTMAAIIKKEKH